MSNFTEKQIYHAYIHATVDYGGGMLNLLESLRLFYLYGDSLKIETKAEIAKKCTKYLEEIVRDEDNHRTQRCTQLLDKFHTAYGFF